MRILMISDVYFPRINGVSTSIQTFRRGLHAAGHETILIAPEYPGAPADHETAILRVSSRGVPRDPEDRAMKLGALRALRAEIERLEPDLVHIQTPFIAHYQGTALARALRVPVVETYHTYFEEYLHHYVPLMPRAVTRFVARRFTVSQCNVLDALVVPSRAMEQALLDYGVRCPMHIIPTGMEMERFAGGDANAFASNSASRRDNPCWCTSAASPTRRTSSSCFACSPGSYAASPARCSSSPAKARRWLPARLTCARSGSLSTCASSAIYRGNGSCSIATVPAICSSSPREPRLRAWCCSKRWRSVSRSSRRRTWERETS